MVCKEIKSRNCNSDIHWYDGTLLTSDQTVKPIEDHDPITGKSILCVLPLHDKRKSHKKIKTI